MKRLSFAGKALVRSAFRMCGLQVTRTPAHRDPVVGLSPLRVGCYTVLTDSEALRRAYEISPEVNSVITRLVAALVSDSAPTAMIDIGANCGDSVALAKSGGPVSVLCIEGDPTVCELLRRNVAQFGRHGPRGPARRNSRHD